MASISTLTDLMSLLSFRNTLNANFTALNADKLEKSEGIATNLTLEGKADFDTNAPIKIEGGYGWCDLIGDITPKTTGVGAPTLDAFRGNVRSFRYSVGDDGDCVFHIPHDYAPGTDLFMHVHWAHNGTNISGTLAVNFFVSYAKGHNQASNGDFITEKTPILSVGSLSIANTPQYRHRVDEIQISSSTPSASLLDTATIETDGLILVNFDVATIPTITGGGGEPFIFTLDIHYQSTGLPTKNKSPDFRS